MRDLGKRNVLGVLVDAVDREAAVARVIEAAKERRPYGVTALAVHGVMTGVDDPVHRYRLNHLDLVTPDGQPVRWAINWLHGTGLKDNVHGSGLTLGVCESAADEDLSVYLYGSRREVLSRMVDRLRDRFPRLQIAGAEPSLFRQTEPEERDEIVERILGSGAAMTFVGLGCPRQEVFVYEYRDRLRMPVLAVGAAFDYLAGMLREPHPLVRRTGLEWFHRLIQEPTRLWKRYTVVNGRYLWHLGLQVARVARPDPAEVKVPQHDLLYG